MGNNNLVTVVITTRNRASLLGRAINSVLEQTYKKIEIIIVDDCSIDNTEELVKGYIKIYGNIKYIKHEETLGGNAARNTGIRAACGEFIAGLDDDDEFTPNRIELLMDNYSDTYSLITGRSIKITKETRQKTKYVSEVDLDTMLYFNAIGNQVLVKRERIIGAGLFDENLKRYQDYDMWLRIIIKYGKAKIIDEITQIIHYEHDVSSNNIIKNNLHGGLKFYKKHKHLMNKPQKKMQLYLLYKLQNKNLTYKKAWFFLTFKTYKLILESIIFRK